MVECNGPAARQRVKTPWRWSKQENSGHVTKWTSKCKEDNCLAPLS